MSSSITAFQVLIIGTLEDVNLESTLRSLVRHVTGSRNEVAKDIALEKKRKRAEIAMSPPHVRHESVPNGAMKELTSPPKKVRNGESPSPVAERKLSKSIESLYKSIMSAQEELEAGRTWERYASNDM
jgi:hypothetical protein